MTSGKTNHKTKNLSSISVNGWGQLSYNDPESEYNKKTYVYLVKIL